MSTQEAVQSIASDLKNENIPLNEVVKRFEKMTGWRY